jgi:hypothetical protein
MLRKVDLSSLPKPWDRLDLSPDNGLTYSDLTQICYPPKVKYTVIDGRTRTLQHYLPLASLMNEDGGVHGPIMCTPTAAAKTGRGAGPTPPVFNKRPLDLDLDQSSLRHSLHYPLRPPQIRPNEKSPGKAVRKPPSYHVYTTHPYHAEPSAPASPA